MSMTEEDIAEIKLQQAQEALLGEDHVRLEIAKSMSWDRQVNSLQVVHTARVMINRPFASGRANWVQAGIMITVAPGKDRSDLLTMLAKFIDDV